MIYYDGKSERKVEEKSPVPNGIWTHYLTSLSSRGECSTAALQPRPQFSALTNGSFFQFFLCVLSVKSWLMKKKKRLPLPIIEQGIKWLFFHDIIIDDFLPIFVIF